MQVSVGWDAGPGEYWVGGVLADPGALGLMQNRFGASGLQMQWEFPLALGCERGPGAEAGR